MQIRSQLHCLHQPVAAPPAAHVRSCAPDARDASPWQLDDNTGNSNQCTMPGNPWTSTSWPGHQHTSPHAAQARRYHTTLMHPATIARQVTHHQHLPGALKTGTCMPRHSLGAGGAMRATAPPTATKPTASAATYAAQPSGVLAATARKDLTQALPRVVQNTECLVPARRLWTWYSGQRRGTRPLRPHSARTYSGPAGRAGPRGYNYNQAAAMWPPPWYKHARHRVVGNQGSQNAQCNATEAMGKATRNTQHIIRCGRNDAPGAARQQLLCSPPPPTDIPHPKTFHHLARPATRPAQHVHAGRCHPDAHNMASCGS